MNAKRTIFSAGGSACDDSVAGIQRIACTTCEIEVLDMRDPVVTTRAWGPRGARRRGRWPTGCVLRGIRFG
jgi:hypothetical protein